MNTSSLSGYRVLFADDKAEEHALIVPALQAAGVLVTACYSGSELRTQLTQIGPYLHAVITDIYGIGDAAHFVPERDLRQFCQHYPQIAFVAYSGSDWMVQKFEHLGVRGYVLKDGTPFAVLQALESLLVLQREVFYSDNLSFENRLSDREREVLELTALGLSMQKIADELYLSAATVRTYLNRCKQKLCPAGEESTERAIALAARDGLIDPTLR